ncbi:MAG: hypothetical protein IK066_11875 [Kiritimatiellae bacterium]|nr:hypothetical protein [Kiritimatiellia bacterium]
MTRALQKAEESPAVTTAERLAWRKEALRAAREKAASAWPAISLNFDSGDLATGLMEKDREARKPEYCVGSILNSSVRSMQMLLVSLQPFALAEEAARLVERLENLTHEMTRAEMAFRSELYARVLDRCGFPREAASARRLGGA